MIAQRPLLRKGREFADELLYRAPFLGEVDATLLRKVIGHRVLPRELGLLSGQSVRAIQRRVNVLIKRLHDPEVIFIIRHHADWSPDLREVALAVWLRREPLRDIARRMGLSLHRVRQHVETIRGVLGETCTPQRRPSADDDQ